MVVITILWCVSTFPLCKENSVCMCTLHKRPKSQCQIQSDQKSRVKALVYGVLNGNVGKISHSVV